LRIFLSQFCEFFVILWFNLFKILDFNRNSLYTHFCFSVLLIFFWAIGALKKLQIFKKIMKKHHSGELHKKVQFCTRRHKSHFFMIHPVLKKNYAKPSRRSSVVYIIKKIVIFSFELFFSHLNYFFIWTIFINLFELFFVDLNYFHVHLKHFCVYVI